MSKLPDAAQPHRILLVDDQYDIRSIVGMALGKIGGFTVHVCHSGEQALDNAPTFAPDLLLLDVSMPVLDGVATLQHLRARGVTAPAIFFTSRAEPADRARYASAGALGTIQKPFDPLRLRRQILQLWTEAQAGRA